MKTVRCLCVVSLLVVVGCQSGQLTSFNNSRREGPEIVLIDAGASDAPDAGRATDAGPGQDVGPGQDAGPVCTPSCGGVMCGDDGCGGSCGSCGAGETCSAGSCQAPAVEGCPPSGPFGSSPGQTATNLTLFDCDGNPVELHSLCSRRVSYVYTFAEWCGNCRTFVRTEIENKHTQYSAMGELETWIVLTAVSGGGNVDAAACRRIRDSYNIDTPGVRVLFDPTGETGSVLGMRVNTADMVMTRHNEIVINGPWAWSTVERGLNDAFGATTP